MTNLTNFFLVANKKFFFVSLDAIFLIPLLYMNKIDFMSSNPEKRSDSLERYEVKAPLYNNRLQKKKKKKKTGRRG